MINNKKTMNFLSIDCSTDVGSLFLKVKNKSFSKFLQYSKYSNDLLMKQILLFLSENNYSLASVDEVHINQGPGNFSGLRGSISTSKGICLAKNIDLFGYNTFLLACVKFYKSKQPIYSLIKIKENYFIQKFNKKLTHIFKPKPVKIENIIKDYNNEIKVLDKRYVKFFDNDILKCKNLHILNLDYSELELLKKNNLLQKNVVSPIYLW
tara:strand:- start:711 stop:1337 length:627 start_codon:yes stop_codon:yes gene_type:complete